MKWLPPSTKKIAGHFVKIQHDIKVNELFDKMQATDPDGDINADLKISILTVGIIGLATSYDSIVFFRPANDVIDTYVKRLEVNIQSIELAQMEISGLINTVPAISKIQTNISSRVLGNIFVLY